VGAVSDVDGNRMDELSWAAQDLYWRLLASKRLLVGFPRTDDGFLQLYRGLARQVQELFAAYRCFSSIMAGGVDWYFEYQNAVLAPEAVMAFRAIGLPAAASVIASGISRFPSPYPRSTEVRGALMSETDLDLADLNASFYEIMAEGVFENAANMHAGAYLAESAEGPPVRPGDP
jgi:hypothetical protein